MQIDYYYYYYYYYYYHQLKCGFIKKYILFVHLIFHVATDICKS